MPFIRDPEVPMIDHDEDRLLVEQAQRHGDPEALGRLYDKYYQPIFRFLLYRTSDVDLAKDLTSETFFQMLKSLWRFRWQGKPFSAWLYRIAYHQFLTYSRNHRKYCPLTSEEDTTLLSHHNVAEELLEQESAAERLNAYQQVRQAMRHLSDREQGILILRFFVKKSIHEIAMILRIPQGTVKSHIHRGLRKLQQLLVPQKFDATLHRPSTSSEFSYEVPQNNTYKPRLARGN